MQRRPLAVLAGAIFVLAACNALTGVGDLGIGPTSNSEGGSGAEGGAGGGDGGGGDGSALDDSGVPVDPAIPVVTPSLASCGLRSVCLSTRDGWTTAVRPLIGFGQGGCPSEWPIQSTHKESGGGSCRCACTPSAGSCGGAIEARSGATCGGAATTLGVGTNGTCTLMEAGVPATVALKTTGTAPSSCAGAVDDDLQPPDEGITCTGAMTTTSAACAASEICVPKPLTQLGIPAGSLCMAHDGAAGCPNNLPVRIVVGDAITDNRSCESACSCGPAPCSGKLAGFTTAGCSGAAAKSWDVDGKCDVSAIKSPATSFRYTANVPCDVKVAPKVIGTETITKPRTFCCTTPSFFDDD